MKMSYKGRQRKELAAAIAEITGEKAVYMKAPTYVYQIGSFTVVCCIIEIPKVADQKWRKLHLHFGESCKTL